MNSNIVLTISLIAIAISIASIAATQTTSIGANPQINANEQTNILQQKDFVALKKFVTSEIDEINIDVIKLDLKTSSSERADNLETRMIAVEASIKTLGKTQIKVVTHESEKITFDLKLTDSTALEQDVFRIGNVVYISGDASVTTDNSITIKVRDQEGFVIANRSVGIPDEGRFTSVFTVPNNAAGVYTITISDRFTVDSIRFEVK